MEYFTEQAPTYSECMRRIRAKYGDGAKVLMQRSVRIGGFFGLFARDGVEMTGVVGPDKLYQRRGAEFRGAADLRGAETRPAETRSADYRSADFRGDVRSGADSRGEGRPADLRGAELEEEKKKLLAAAKGGTDPTLQLVLSEVRTLKEKLDAGAAKAAAEEHPTLSKIAELLALNDFSHAYSRGIQDRLKRDFSLEALDDFNAVQDRVVDWVGESVRLYGEEAFKARPRVLVLVGPTGVGKTTTIAKLAAVYGLAGNGGRPLSVRMITIDNYRIAARQQIETYGNIMGIPVSCVETFDDLRKTIALYAQDVDLILVDTIGKSPRDNIKLAEMKQLLAACGSGAEVHLAMAATTKSSDIREILQQFEPFDYRSVIVTKLDETIRIGNVVSALSERGKSVSYITDGQRVPQDIQRASVVRFLINLEGFRIDRRRVDEKFSSGNADTIEWR